MNDADFETELFGLYGEPSEATPDGGVTQRVMSEIAREERLRSWALGLAVGVGAAGTLAAAAVFAGPFASRLASQLGAPAPVLWLLVPLAATFMGWATVRLALDT